ncbi:uncharacterized protein FTOL_12747 [Fusarium torulosum]|uniref:Uncharacterized protein n=1 Tax=Fusarium torulosum TaxID=33205 RepID=A0AAE8ML04_9HYPO|nr:uncharacterized protein FTOL_12747 [Fusarium torulosum]
MVHNDSKSLVDCESLSRTIYHSLRPTSREGGVDIAAELYLPVVLNATLTDKSREGLGQALEQLRHSAESVPASLFYHRQLGLSAVATSLPFLKSYEFAKALTWILQEFKQALASNNDTVILDPHNLASLAYAALQVDHTSEAYQSIEILLYFCLPDLFQPDRTSQGMSPIELIFDVASAASIANFMTSAAGYRLLGDASTWKLFQSIVSQDLERFDLSLVKPLADLFSKYFARRLTGTMDTKPLEVFIQRQTGRLLEAELGPTASFINLGMSLGLDTKLVTEVLGNMEMDMVDQAGRTLIHASAERGLDQAIQYLTTASASKLIDVGDNEGRTPLHEAAGSDFPHTVNTLLEAGAQVDVTDKDGRTPLHEAAGSDFPHTVNTLLEAGAQVDVTDKDGRTPLHEAAKRYYSDTVKALLEAGAQVDVTDKDGRTPLHEAVVKGYSSDTVNTLLEAGAQVDVTDKDGRTPLHEAAKMSSSDTVNALLEAGAQVDVTDKDGRTPLHEAAVKGYSSDTVKALLEAGAEANVKDNEGRTPLFIAVQTDISSYYPLFIDLAEHWLKLRPYIATELRSVPSRAVVDTLLNFKANTQLPNTEGLTVFHVAAQGSSTGCLQLLLNHLDTRADMQDCRGDTPLHLAMESGSYPNAALLTSKYTSFLIKNHKGMTPLDVASKRSRKALWILIRAARLSQITKPNKQPEEHDRSEDPDWPEDYFAEASKNILSNLRKATMRSRVPRYQMLDDKQGTIPRLQTFPLGRSSTSIPARVRREVRERLKATNHRGWAVLCVSLGVTQDDAVPAIVVIHPLAEKLWEDVSSSIGDGVEYLIEKGSISRQSNLISELRMFQNEPRNGSSIGSVSTDSRWGSLGGYLRLKDGDVLAMTCGHVLTRGDRLDSTTACVQPSFYHHNNHLHRTCLQEFLNNHGQWNYTCSTPATCPYFGLVDRICTRTLSVSCEGAAEPELVTISIDWAILKNLSRPARQNTIHGRAVRGWRAILYTVNGNGEIEVGNGQKVFMQGARSGEVQGNLTSPLVGCCLEGNSEETQEIGIIGCDGKSFSAQGDSGSWVIEVDEDEQGNGSVIGVLLGGYYDGTACFSLITPMEHLLKDIEETMGSKIDFPEWGSTHS